MVIGENMNINRLLFVIVGLFLANNATQQPQASGELTDDDMQNIILADLQSLSDKEFNQEVARLSKVNKQYNRVMHKPAVIQYIIIKRIEPIPTKKKFDSAIEQLSQNPDYKKEFDTSSAIKKVINKKNKQFDIIAHQIQPKLDEIFVPTIDIVNRVNGINTISKGKTVLQWAIDFELDLDFIKLLIQAGADPNLSGVSVVAPPLILTIRLVTNADDRFAIAKLLLDAGADPNYIFKIVTHHLLSDEETLSVTPLISAALQGQLDILKLLLKYGADPLLDVEGKTQLYWFKLSMEAYDKPDKKVRDKIIALLEDAETQAKAAKK